MLAKQIDFFFFFLKPKSGIGRNLYFCRNLLKFARMDGTLQNRPKFDPKWNMRYYGTGLHAGMKYSGRNGQNK